MFFGGSIGYYCSATPYGSFNGNAYDLKFNNSNVSPSDYSSRGHGNSVRLVCSVSK